MEKVVMSACRNEVVLFREKETYCPRGESLIGLSWTKIGTWSRKTPLEAIVLCKTGK